MVNDPNFPTKGKWQTVLDWNPATGLLMARVEFRGSVREEDPSMVEALENLGNMVAWSIEKARVREQASHGVSNSEDAPPPTPSALERAAQQTLDIMQGESQAGGQKDVILTLTIVMLVVKLAIVVYNCLKKPGQRASICYDPNWIHRLLLRRVVRKVLAPKGYGDQVGAVTAALLKMAKALSKDDIEAIFKEATADPEIWTTAASLGLV